MGTKYSHLSPEERGQIELLLSQNESQRSIGRILGRSASSIHRELKRNGWRPATAYASASYTPPAGGNYFAKYAGKRAEAQRKKPRQTPKLAQSGVLWPKVSLLLKQKHSPAQVSSLLKSMYPGNIVYQVCHETIYTALYALPRGELKRESAACFRQQHPMRRSRKATEERRGKLLNMVSIRDRPPEAEERLIPGHWEGDLIKGARNASAVGTLVDRATLFVALVKMDDCSAESALKGFGGILNRLDAQYRKTLTYDQGKEMALHVQLTEQTQVKVYFADPHSPWQRGLNENTNGLLRQYLPKGSDLSVYSQQELDDIAWQLNTRPRKSLNWQCPAERFLPDFDFRKYYFEHIDPPDPQQ